jgi:hypothetical protein
MHSTYFVEFLSGCLFLNKDSVTGSEWILIGCCEFFLFYVLKFCVLFSSRMSWRLAYLSEFASWLEQDTDDELIMTWHEISRFSMYGLYFI